MDTEKIRTFQSQINELVEEAFPFDD